MNLSTVFVFTTLFLLSSLSLSAQSDKDSSKNNQYLRLNIDNDMLIWRERTDRYFTSGLRLDYLRAANKNKPSCFKDMIPKLQNSEIYLGVSLVFNMYTPKNRFTEAIVLGDRPYAGWAYIAYTGISNSKSKAMRLKTEYSLGALGPITQQEELQTAVHKWANRPLSKGWKNQILNDLAANVLFSVEKRVISPTEYLDILGIVEANIGTVTNYMGLGGLVRLGWFEDYFDNVMPLKTSKDWQVFVFTRPTVRLMTDNSLLQGGVFNYEKSPYVIQRDDLKHVYLDVGFGYSLTYRSFNITCIQNFRTPEFKDAQNMFWGTVTFSYGF
ncbi:MAG: lipid A deacylase LpxR family protein [Saprospiraceae bacterium]|nr:lipid A deacylase LpxR family protein [Saprospiraceae bacterium]